MTLMPFPCSSVSSFLGDSLVTPGWDEGITRDL